MSPLAAQMNGVGGQGSACFPIMSFHPFYNNPQGFSAPFNSSYKKYGQKAEFKYVNSLEHDRAHHCVEMWA